MSWLVGYNELSDDQTNAVDASIENSRFIMGAPGSGKSLVLVHRAARLLEKYNVPPSKYRILIFTKVLKDYIISACKELPIDRDCISTYDSWCRGYYLKYVSNELPTKSTNRNEYFKKIRQNVWKHTRTVNCPIFDFVLVDEGQDLDLLAFETLTAVSKHVTVCADYKQQIYDNGASKREIAERLGLRNNNFNLLDAFRCSPEIVRLAATFIENPVERKLFEQQKTTWSEQKERPLLYITKNFETEKQRLIEIIRQRIDYRERVAVLFRSSSHVLEFANYLDSLGISVESQYNNSKRSLGKLDFNTLEPKVMTYHSAKGITVDSVLMPQLTNYLFSDDCESMQKRLIFVGLTRATKWAYLSTIESQQLNLLKSIASGLGTNIVVQTDENEDNEIKNKVDQSKHTEPTIDDIF